MWDLKSEREGGGGENEGLEETEEGEVGGHH